MYDSIFYVWVLIELKPKKGIKGKNNNNKNKGRKLVSCIEIRILYFNITGWCKTGAFID